MTFSPDTCRQSINRACGGFHVKPRHYQIVHCRRSLARHRFGKASIKRPFFHLSQEPGLCCGRPTACAASTAKHVLIGQPPAAATALGLSRPYQRPRPPAHFIDRQATAIIPNLNRQKRNSTRHPTLRRGLLGALDQRPCPQPDRGEDAMPESLRRAHRCKTPRQPDPQNPDLRHTDQLRQRTAAPPRSSAWPDAAGESGCQALRVSCATTPRIAADVIAVLQHELDRATMGLHDQPGIVDALFDLAKKRAIGFAAEHNRFLCRAQGILARICKNRPCCGRHSSAFQKASVRLGNWSSRQLA